MTNNSNITLQDCLIRMGICQCLPVQACPETDTSYRPLPCDFSSRIPIPLQLWVNSLRIF